MVCVEVFDMKKLDENDPEIKRIMRELNEFTPDDFVRLVLLEAGYENEPLPFDEVELQRLLYKNRELVPILEQKIAFRTSGTYPYSEYVERIMMRMKISGVFAPVDKMQLCEGTKEYHEKEFPDLDDTTKQMAKEIGAELRKRMLD